MEGVPADGTEIKLTQGAPVELSTERWNRRKGI